MRGAVPIRRPRITRNARRGPDQGPRITRNTRNGPDQGPRITRNARRGPDQGPRITRNARRGPDQGPRNTRNARSGPWSGPRRRGDVGGDPPLPVGLTRPDAQIRAVLRRRFRHVVASAGVAQIARRGGSAGGGPCRHRHGMTGEPARNLVGPDRHRLTGADAMKRGWGTVRNTQSRPAWLVCSAALS